jgi:hypothetical protein
MHESIYRPSARYGLKTLRRFLFYLLKQLQKLQRETSEITKRNFRNYKENYKLQILKRNFRNYKIVLGGLSHVLVMSYDIRSAEILEKLAWLTLEHRWHLNKVLY